MDLVSFYKDKTILLTGSTGFVGKHVLEKILRSLGNFKCVYVLVRPKKNTTIEERLEQEIFTSQIFDTILKS